MTSSKERLWHAVPDQHMYLSSLLVASNQQNIGNKGRGSTCYGRLWEMLANEKEKESTSTSIHSSIVGDSEKGEEDVDTLSSLAAFSPSATSIKETSEEKPQEEKLEDKNELMLPAQALKGKVSRNRYKSLLMRQRERLYQIIGPKATGSVIKLMASRCGYYTVMIVRGPMKGREMKVRHYEIRAL
jgi:hypothetical protein